MKHVFLTFGMFCFGSLCMSQNLSVVSAGGAYTEGPGGSVSWTLGEVIIVTSTGSSIDATQGFQQGNIYVTGIEDLNEISVNIYPNPTSEFVTIQSPEPVRVSVFDASGRLVAIHDLTDEINQINVTDFARGTYNLVFQSAGSDTRTVQLIVM